MATTPSKVIRRLDPDARSVIARYSGWILVIFICVIPVLRWLMLVPLSDRFGSSFAIWGSFGKIAAVIGMLLYCLNLILATRLRVFEDFFGGLNRVYIAHHIIGGIALILLVFHPTFLALRYIEHESLATIHDAAVFLLPRGMPLDQGFDGFQQGFAINDGIIAMLGMVFLLILTFFVKLPYRLWLFTHKFLGLAFFFAILHTYFISSDINRDLFLKWYILIFSALGLIAFIYRTLMPKILIRSYKYNVEQVAVVGDGVVEISMKPFGEAMSFEPGQFVFIKFLDSGDPNISDEAHPFSLSSSPDDEFLRISAKALGDYTKALLALKSGVTAEIEGAYGHFSYTRYNNAKQIWIAGGIGITPFLSMARTLKDDTIDVDLYYSVKSTTEFVDFEVLSQLVPQLNKRFRAIPWVANDRGFLTAEAIEKESTGLKGKEFFICGPPMMMKAMRSQLRALGVPNSMIHSEEFAMS